jgi:hypothetical protein
MARQLVDGALVAAGKVETAAIGNGRQGFNYLDYLGMQAVFSLP